MTAGRVWVVVLLKDFDSAKQRLRPALEPAERRALAVRNAERALAAAARTGERVLAVCGSQEAAVLARQPGVEVLVEARPGGQNPAARAGIRHAAGRGAGAVLLLSSDLPLVSAGVVEGMLAAARGLGERAVLAAPATGRGGTNALYLRPPDVVGLHFGDRSLAKFEREAAALGVRFALHEVPELALDLDEPGDLEALAQLR